MQNQYTITLSQSQVQQSKQNKATDLSIKLLRLKKGSSFWNLQQDFEAIYNNFNIIYYFSNHLEIKVLNQFYNQEKNNEEQLKIIQFTFEGSKESVFIVQKRKDKLTKDHFKKLPNLQATPLYIQYEIYNNIEYQKLLGKIKVVVITKEQQYTNKQFNLCHFRKERIGFIDNMQQWYKNWKIKRQKIREVIQIKVIDQTGWINDNLGNISIDQRYHRISATKKSKLREVQYFYKQPLSQRFKQFQNEHVSLALQGGGCKGVQYLGTYKALRNNGNLHEKIKSVIGSSAGGILGLAITCALDPADIEKVCIDQLSRVADDKTFKQVSDDPNRWVKKSYDNLFSFLQKFGLFQDKIIKTLKNVMNDKKFQSLFLQLLAFVTNPQVYKLFADKNRNNEQKLNMAGLMNASLMTGDIMANIAITILSMFIRKKTVEKDQKLLKMFQKQKFQKLLKISNQTQRNKQISKIITMKDLYQITQVQFTCTSVDIDNQVLRFFNQKTTPNLPVCKAVQMTGSFPVAFKAQQWKKEWGKYYIHYDTIRKQIDLTGCTFTDGGALANFPIKYLDNQSMRPMYFSHMKTDKTIMYGLGLTQKCVSLLQKVQKNPQQLRPLQNIIEQMISIAVGYTGKLSSFWSWLKQVTYVLSGGKKTQVKMTDSPFQLLFSIPIIGFVFKIIQTYCNTKDNLNQECFCHQTFTTNVGINHIEEIQNRPDKNSQNQTIQNLFKQIQTILKLPQVKSKNLAYFITFKQNLNLLKKQALQNCLIQETLFERQKALCNIFSLLLFNFANISYLQKYDQQKIYKILVKNIQNSLKQYVNVNEQKKLVSKILQVIHRISKQKIFLHSQIQKDHQTLNKISQMIINFFGQLSQDNQLKQLVQQTFNQVKQIEQEQLKQSLGILQHFRQYKTKQAQNRTEIKINSYIIAIITKIKNIQVILPLPNVRKALRLIKTCSVPQIFVSYQAQNSANTLKSYVLNHITAQCNKCAKQCASNKVDEPDGVHLVLQAVPLSELYFHQYYRIVQDTLFQYNNSIKKLNDKNKFLKVTTMTGTSYHCIAMFLAASDLPQVRITQQIWKIRDLIKLNPQDFQKKIVNGDWAKLTPILLRQMQKTSMDRQKDILSYIEQNLLNNAKSKIKTNQQYEKLKLSIHNQMENIKLQQQDMVCAIQSTLNYVSAQLLNIDSKQLSASESYESLIDNLMLKVSSKYSQKQIQKNKQVLQNVSKFFLNKYCDIIKYIVYQSPLISDHIMNILSKNQRQYAWKGAILSQFYSGTAIKNYIRTLLKEMGLKPNTTLRQFYENTSKKIQLNFSAIENSYVAIFNHLTRPNMPIWAAVLASSSIPQFFPPVIDQTQWKFKQQTNYKKRQVINYFEQSPHPFKLLWSSEVLTTMPMDLLQNNQMMKKITEKKNQIFFVFNFTDIKFETLGRQMVGNKFSITSLTIGQLISKFVSFRQLFWHKVGSKSQTQYSEQLNVNAIKNFFKLPAVKSKLNLMKLYVSSNDNLMIKMYKRQLIQLPIRFNTLDFHLMTQQYKIETVNKKDEIKTRLSDICEDAIMQAQFILTQKITNSYKNVQQQLIKQNNNHHPSQPSQPKQNEFHFYSVPKVILLQNLSKRLIYFRVQNYANNKLNLRFLSFLNPSQQTYEKYFIYYCNSSQGGNHRNYKKYYKLLTQQSIIMEKEINNSILKLKIQYPSANLQKIQTSGFSLNLQQLYNLSKNNEKFGYIYCLQFDNKLYGSYGANDYLQPHAVYKYDYMNRKRDNTNNPPKILVKKQVQNTKQETTWCSNCLCRLAVDQIQIPIIRQSRRKVYSMTKACPPDFRQTDYSPKYFNNSAEIRKKIQNRHRSQYLCQSCNTKDLVINKYHISYNHEKGHIQCQLGHPIQKYEDSQLNQYGVAFYLCDLCGKGSIQSQWNDSKCGIQICQSCRMEALQQTYGSRKE